MDINDLHEQLKQADIVKILFTDLNGQPVGLSINADNIENIIRGGVGFDGSSIAGYASVDNSDKILVPVKDSFRIIKYKDRKIGYFVGNIEDREGTRSCVDPRLLLEKMIQKAKDQFGCRFLIGPEYEFFLLNGDEFSHDIHTDKSGYFHIEPHNKGDFTREEIVRSLKESGFNFEKDHHEVTPSQHEINFEKDSPMKAADQTLFFVQAARQIAADHGFFASFMPKPFDGYNRSAFHIHLSMQDIDSKENLFYSDDDPHNLSKKAKHFMAGIVKYARETSIIMASTNNSYKAYIMGKEAPIIRGWGLRNRSSMIRLPYAPTPASTRIELRSPDPSGNVYLQLAVLIAMGLRGMEDELTCPNPDEGNTYTTYNTSKTLDERFLPKCMFEALMEAERSEFLRETLGETMYQNYLSLKRNEWEEMRTHVFRKEFNKYLRY